MFDANSVVILDGNVWLRASDVSFFDPESGLALIRTEQAGVPLLLADGPLDSSEILKRVGYTFRLSSNGVFAVPSWNFGPAKIDGKLYSLSSLAWFGVYTKLNAGSCGSPIIQKDGRLVGIIHQRIGKDKASVIGPASISEAVRSVSDE